MKLNRRLLFQTTVALTIALIGMTSLGHAETIWGLSTVNSIFRFDSATPATVTGTVSITGLGGGESITDIDFSPVNFLLYGMATNGSLYSINTATGAATLRLAATAQNPASTITAPTAVDFNPSADRLRVFQGANNFRLTPDASAFDNAGLNAGDVTTDGAFTGLTNFTLSAAAYTNSVNGAATTTLYSIDSQGDRLIIHSGGPQFSTIASVGALGVDVGTNVGFDISPTQGTATGYVSNGNSFYTVNLSTGALTSGGTIGAAGLTTKSIAVVPEPASVGLLGLGAVAVGWVARRRR